MTVNEPEPVSTPRERSPHEETAERRRYLLVGMVADIQRVAVLVHLLRPTTRRRAILTVWLARVGTEVLRWQRLQPTDGERQEGKERRREREGSGLPSVQREERREVFHQGGTEERGQPCTHKSLETPHTTSLEHRESETQAKMCRLHFWHVVHIWWCLYDTEY